MAAAATSSRNARVQRLSQKAMRFVCAARTNIDSATCTHHHRLNLSPSLPFCLSIFLAQAQYFELLKRYRAPDQRLWGNIGIVDGSVCIEGWAWLCESCVLSTRLRQLIFLPKKLSPPMKEIALCRPHVHDQFKGGDFVSVFFFF